MQKKAKWAIWNFNGNESYKEILLIPHCLYFLINHLIKKMKAKTLFIVYSFAEMLIEKNIAFVQSVSGRYYF